jgi:hypothetical protein
MANTTAAPISSSSITNLVATASTVAGSLNFPSDLGISGNFNYWMSFSFYNYQPQTFTGNPILQDQGTVRLPLPNNMLDQQDVLYDATHALGLTTGWDMNQMGAENRNPLAISGAAVAGTVAGQVVGNTKLGQALAKDASAYNDVLQPRGLAVNPFMTVLFKNPLYKEHTFNWQLAPTTSQETLIMNSIINTFRMNQLPGSTAGGGLLTYPNIVQITISNNDPNKFTYIFKPTVIKSFAANFTPGNTPAFFGSTQAPAIVEIRMTLQEIEFWLQTDFNGLNYGTITSIGDYLNGVNTNSVNSLTNLPNNSPPPQ